MVESMRSDVLRLIEHAHDMIADGSTSGGMDRLMNSLNDARSKGLRGITEVMTRQDVVEHPLAKVIHQDSLTLETFMDWHLIYRDEWEMIHVAAEIERSEVASLRLYRDEPGNLVFLEIRKSGNRESC